MVISTIFFDWGGVLIDLPNKQMFTYCAKVLGISDQKISEFYQKHEDAFQRGMAEIKFWEMAKSELNITIPNLSLWGEAFRRNYYPRKVMFDLVASLHRNGYKTGLLSNAEPPAADYWKEQRYDMFDAAVFSCVEGVRKPERRIYEIALERLRSQPAESVFIDDNQRYADGAKSVGLNAILFRDQDQVKQELASLSVKLY